MLKHACRRYSATTAAVSSDVAQLGPLASHVNTAFDGSVKPKGLSPSLQQIC